MVQAGGAQRLFAEEKLRRDPTASDKDVLCVREHATHAPTILAFIVRPQRHVLVLILEQWLSPGAGLSSILSATHLLGFGAIIAGIETMHMIKKGKLDFVKDRTSSAADKFYSLAF